MTIGQNHSIRLYFPYTFDSSAPAEEYHRFIEKIQNNTVSDLLAQAPFVAPQVHPKFAESNVWHSTETKLDKRFHDFSHELINGMDNTSHSNGFFGLKPLVLSQEAIRILNQGSPSSLGLGITFELKKASATRLAKKNISAPLENNCWPMMFNSIVFYGLNNGIGLLVIDVSFKQAVKNGVAIRHIEELLELNYAIARNSNDHQSSNIHWQREKNDSKTNGLSSLVDALLPIEENNTLNLRPTKDRGNCYTYTFASSEKPLEKQDKDNFIFRMARKYNDLYLPENPHSQISYFEPFKTITHAFCLEGATTYIDLSQYSQQVPESIKNFGKTAIVQAYAPLILLTYAEYIFLREMASNSHHDKKVDLHNPTEENLSKLRSFRSKLYDFRLNFRYTQISSNTNHNLFCSTNKKALQIEQLLNETTNDVDEVEQYIADQVSQKQEVRLKNFGVIGSLFAVIIGWVDLWGINLNDIIYKNTDTEISSIVIFLVVLVILSVTIIYSSDVSFFKKIKKSESSNFKKNINSSNALPKSNKLKNNE